MSADVPRSQRISLRTVADGSTRLGRRLRTWAPLLDRLLGIHAIDRFCQQHQLYGLPPLAFASRALESLAVQIDDGERMAQVLPREGPVIVAANHPHGGIEGLVMVRLLAALRPDLKIMANTALRVFSELAPMSIYVNPLAPGDPVNRRGLRECFDHLAEGGLLLMFPAGRTSFYQAEIGRIADSPWNSVLGRLARRANAQVLPVRFTGKNSRLFYSLGNLWYRFRLLMLARELMNKAGQRVQVLVGQPIEIDRLKVLEADALTQYLQVECASLSLPMPSAELDQPPLKPLATPRARVAVEGEIAALPASQRLLQGKGCVVGVARQVQVPELLEEIRRERERTYRLEQEGSGEAADGDAFDAEVDHLFCWDQGKRALVGAYRIFRRDVLTADGQTYLEQMFAFDEAFFGAGPALELGRSFVVPEYQRDRYALDLLWRGIGAYLQCYPQYRLLYGTVSLSRTYDPVSVAMMCDVLIDESASTVRPRRALSPRLPGEWQRFRRDHDLTLTQLNALIAARELDGKGLPVLLRHYAALNARFHAVAVDPNFAATPGLLLSVSLADLPSSKRRRYLA